MKNSLTNFAEACWSIFTEVPGWIDAPRKLRVRRALPIVVPVAAMVLLTLWNLVWTQPHIQAERAACLPLLALQEEVAGLQLTTSDQNAAEVAARAAAASQTLLPPPNMLAPVLDELKATVHANGWETTFHLTTGASTPSQPDAQINFVALRGKLAPTADNDRPFFTLLSLFEQFSRSARWIDLMSVSLRADEQGRYTAEIYLRAGCLIPNEKTTE